MTIQHTPECIQQQEEFDIRVNLWVTKYPNYCKTCFGRGAITWEEDVAGDGKGGQQMTDVCECVEANKCGRCGSTLTSVTIQEWQDVDRTVRASDCDASMCKACGWNDFNQSEEFHNPDEGFGAFGGGPCDCELEDMRKQEEEYQKGRIQ